MSLPDVAPLDRQFGAFISRLAGSDASPLLEALAALTAAALRSGHVCLDLVPLAGDGLRLAGETIPVPSLEEVTVLLHGTAVVGAPGEYRPLILDRGGRLYLYRYHRYERQLADDLLALAGSAAQPPDADRLAEGLERLFPDAGGPQPDRQRQAALTALHRRLSIISGGPGTGKTATVVRILALLLEQAADGLPPRIALAAPTGKAAARLRESIRTARETLPCDERIRQLIPDRAVTLHRLLGTRPGSVRFRHCRDNPLPSDVVIVDEASMVSLPLMAKLTAALKPGARLILLGDRDQLASVEAGAVLGDICAGGDGSAAAGEPSPLARTITVLTRTYRFREGGGIGALAAAMNAGDGRRALAVLDGEQESVALRELPAPGELKRELRQSVIDGFRPYLTAPTPEEALARFADFRLLTPLRQGTLGVEGLNRLVEELLTDEGLIRPLGRWYAGRPVLVTVNAPALHLFNGDIGIAWPDPAAAGQLRVCFVDPDGGSRWLAPARLPDHETAFALTVHKSQGSEFSRLLLLLPRQDSALLTRELLYTAVTRARERVELWGDRELLHAAISRRIERNSGLREALWPCCPVDPPIVPLAFPAKLS
ncbi:exodeoxyribonuclease V subunit alpha [Trichlorobacter ammonificans]|nr:exodeoxyribonuclease V subunit alpha [Trichlorobacter ammonificans]